VISRQTKLQLLVFGIVAVLGLVYAGGTYAGLGRLIPGYDKGYLVSADFSDSGGIFTGAQVTYRGVSIGKVEKLSLRPDGVRVALRLKPGIKVPTPTKAVVGNRSAIGEQYVDLQPQNDGSTLLKGGDVIPASMTAIPIQPTQLVVNLDRLVRSVDTADVTVVLDELGQAFDGAGDDLQRLIDAGDQLSTAATQNLPATLRLIQDSKPVLDTQRDLAGDFRSYNANLAQLTTQLRSSDPDFRALFKSGTDSGQVTTQLLEANRANLPVLLDNLVFAAQVQAVRIPAIRQILVSYPNVVAGGFTVTPGDGTAHFGFVTNTNVSACPQTDVGYRGTKQRDPSDQSNRTPNLSAYCSQQSPSPVDVRGARNAPRAEGLPPFPQDRSSSINRSASLYGGVTGTDGYTVGLADYDPSTGHVISATGQQFTLGSTAGAAAVFGESSWQWLLMDPLRHS
jgi:phospholipid/cholesterol/gamma-HCH transport system substrate-binding protein